jgi:hypothetical protein
MNPHTIKTYITDIKVEEMEREGIIIKLSNIFLGLTLIPLSR